MTQREWLLWNKLTVKPKFKVCLGDRLFKPTLNGGFGEKDLK
jgi:hypothetical protein